MAQPEKVISLADRLKSRREERGISQAQAARELDVARTAYRLWEINGAARPAPDRWRLIASWLGISVTAMLLADELVSADEASIGELVEADFNRSGRDWDTVGTAQSGDFFAQARSLIGEGTRGRHLNDEQAEALLSVLNRVEIDSEQLYNQPWANADIRRTLAPELKSLAIARQTVSFAAAGVPEEHLQTALLLVTEFVSNSITHGPEAPIDLYVSIDRSQLRLEVSDRSTTSAELKPASEEGGFGLTFVDAMATRWGAAFEPGRNTTWFELDLPQPGRPTPDAG